MCYVAVCIWRNGYRIRQLKKKKLDDLNTSLLQHQEREQKAKEPLNQLEKSQILNHLDTLTLNMDSLSEEKNNDINMKNKFTSTEALITGDIVEAALGLATFLDIPKQRMKDILENGEQAIFKIILFSTSWVHFRFPFISIVIVIIITITIITVLFCFIRHRQLFFSFATKQMNY